MFRAGFSSGFAKAVVLKVVDVDPQGNLDHPRGG